jgi:hypothetical protein
MSGFLCSMVGAKPAGAAVVNNAVSFDGDGDFYSATGLTTTATDAGKITVACTFYWAGGNNLQQVVNLRLGTGASDYGFWVWINGGRMQLKVATGTGSVPTSIYEDAENSLTQNAYNQFVIYLDTSSWTTNSKIIVNGVSKAFSNEGTSAYSFNWGNTATTVKIGQKNSSQTGDGTDLNGRISQLYIHNSTLVPTIGNYWNTTSNLPLNLGTNGTATGLAQPLIYHYGTTSTFPTNNGTGFNAYTLTATGNVADAEGPTFGITLPTGVEFQRASGERIRVASLGSKPSNSKAWVASAWYKPASLVTSGTHAMFGTTQTIDGNSPIGFEITGSSTINGYAHFLSGAASQDATFTPGFTVGTWYHIVFRMNGTNSGRTQCWVNGVRYLDIAADNYGQNLPHASTADFGMGARSMSTLYTAHCLDGCLAQVWVYAADYDIETNITKFYNNGLVDFGSAGTTSGLPTPHFYHKGSTQATFDDINGSVTGTATVTGTLSTCS